MDKNSFPPFSLTRLLKTVFAPKPGQRVAIFIDLPDPRAMADFSFLKDKSLTIQRHAFEVFYQGLKSGGLAELQLKGGEMFAYLVTGGSNLDLPATAFDMTGRELNLEKDIYPNYDIILCVSTYSATAPLTAMAKKFGFRGATLHGLNETILRTGLSVDYDEVSRQAEKLRLGLTGADYFEIDFEVLGQKHRLTLQCGRQEAQKSHGLCRGEKPDVANLPAGEVYFVPTSAEGVFPLRYEDGTVGLMTVAGGRVQKAALLTGRQSVIDEHNRKLESDPVTGELGELGFGTQELPPSGRDIQDEKILGTLHVATGRSDHLGGHLTPDKFSNAKNATHDDILFSPTKTPEIRVTQARMYRGAQQEVVIEDYPAVAIPAKIAGFLKGQSEAMPENYYDSQRAASEYLFFHYGDPKPWARSFPARCVTECLAPERLPRRARALDLGCAVGGGTFELARHCAEVVGIDFSRQFIALARRLQKAGGLRFNCCDEGDLTKPRRAVVPRGIDRKRVRFEVGDATRLRNELGKFDVVMMANLIDRVPAPRKLLGQMPRLLNPGGQLIITSPYTWMAEYTPRAQWLGGFQRGGRRISTFSGLKKILSPSFELSLRRDISFLIREHARKYQLGIADATVWLRR